MLLSEGWILFERDKRLLGYSEATIKTYVLQYKLLKSFYDDLELGNYTYEMLKNYLAAASHLKPSSLAVRIKFLRSFFRWALDEGYINTNPAAKIREPKMGQRIPRFLDAETLELLREACITLREKALFEFFYATGCRIGEIYRANREDINWDTNSVVVNGKGNKDRETYFNTRCRILLRRYLDSRKDDLPCLFATERQPYKRASIAQLRYIIKKIAKRAGVDTIIYPHKLRHTYAMHLLNNGAPIEIIQSLLGHSKLDTTKLYTHLSGEMRRQAYNRYF